MGGQGVAPPGAAAPAEFSGWQLIWRIGPAGFQLLNIQKHFTSGVGGGLLEIQIELFLAVVLPLCIFGWILIIEYFLSF